MKRVLPVALTCIALAAAVTWYHGGRQGEHADVNDPSAEPFHDQTPVRIDPPETQPETSVSRAAPVVAESAEPTHSGGDPPSASTGDPRVDPATGAVPAWRAPEDDQIASSPVGAPPADSEVDPATGATIVRRVPDDATAPLSPNGVLPDDVEVDPATGVTTARQGFGS